MISGLSLVNGLYLTSYRIRVSRGIKEAVNLGYDSIITDHPDSTDIVLSVQNYFAQK